MASQLTRTILFNSRIVQSNVRRTLASQSQSSKGPMDYIRQGVDQVKNAFSSEDPKIEKAANDYKNLANQSSGAKSSPSAQPVNTSGTHEPGAEREILRSSGGRATTQSRNYSTSSNASGGYGGSGTTNSQSSPGKRSTSSDPSTGQNAGGSASQQSEGARKGSSANQSGGYGGSDPSKSGSDGISKNQKRNYSSKSSSSSSSSNKESDGLGGFAGSSSASDNYSSGSKGTEQSGPPKRPAGGYVDRNEKTTDQTKDRKAPPSS